MFLFCIFIPNKIFLFSDHFLTFRKDGIKKNMNRTHCQFLYELSELTRSLKITFMSFAKAIFWILKKLSQEWDKNRMKCKTYSKGLQYLFNISLVEILYRYPPRTFENYGNLVWTKPRSSFGLNSLAFRGSLL